MKITKEEFKNIKPTLSVVTYAVLLVCVVLSIPSVATFIGKFLRLFTPLYYAIGIAFVLNIPMRNFESGLKHFIKETNWFYSKIRGIAVLLTLIFSFCVLFVLVTIITPQVVSSIQLLITNATNYVISIVSNFNTILAYLHLDQLDIQINSQTINNYMTSLGWTWESIAQNASTWAIGAGSSLLNNALAFTSGLANWFTGFMLSLYLLSSKEKFIRQFRKAIAAIFGYNISVSVFDLGKKSNRIFTSFISGQLVEACILGSIYFVALSLFKFPFVMLISCVIAITSIVPMFGAMFGMFFGCLLILAVNPIIDVVWFVILFQVIQAFEGNVIYPRVVGNSVGLPGVWVLLSIIVLGGIWGLFGMLIAVPFTALCYNIASEAVNILLQKRQLVVTNESITKNGKL